MFTKIISKKTILEQLKHVADYMTADALMLDLMGKNFSEVPEKYQTRLLNLLNTLCVELRIEKLEGAAREPDKWKWVQDVVGKRFCTEKTLKEKKKRAAKRR